MVEEIRIGYEIAVTGGEPMIVKDTEFLTEISERKADEALKLGRAIQTGDYNPMAPIEIRKRKVRTRPCAFLIAQCDAYRSCGNRAARRRS